MSVEWYVATTQPFSEMIAEASLSRIGIQSFNPKCRAVKIIRGRRIITERPYIAGYIFCRFDRDEDYAWRKIHSQRGIRTLISASAEEPTPIRDVAALDALIERCKGGDVIDESEADLAFNKFIPVGSEVRITEGPMQGHVGVVKLSQKDRVNVVLRMFKRPLAVDLKPDIVEIC
jgi:transcription antitermination factor NusG